MSTYLDNFQEMYTFIDRLLLNSTGALEYTYCVELSLKTTYFV